MKKLFIIPLLMLTACQTAEPQLVRTKIEVVTPDAAMYNCPVVTRYPDPEKLTDVQVAKLLVQLDRNNRTCKNSVDAIQKFLAEAKKVQEAPPSE